MSHFWLKVNHLTIWSQQKQNDSTIMFFIWWFSVHPCWFSFFKCIQISFKSSKTFSPLIVLTISNSYVVVLFLCLFGFLMFVLFEFVSLLQTYCARKCNICWKKMEMTKYQKEFLARLKCILINRRLINRMTNWTTITRQKLALSFTKQRIMLRCWTNLQYIK